MPLHWQGKCSSADKSDNEQTVTRSPEKVKVGDLVFVKTFPFTWDYKQEYGFYIVKFSTPYSAVLESTLHGKSRNVNIQPICLANPLNLLETENTPIRNWG